MTVENFEKLYTEMLNKQKGDNPSDFAKGSCEKAKEAGVYGGDGAGNYSWKNPITREAEAIILDRAGVI